MISGYCGDECLDGYGIIEGTNICDKCAVECLTCSIANNPRKCLRCANNEYFLSDDATTCLKCPYEYALNSSSGECILVCSDGYYKDSEVRECM